MNDLLKMRARLFACCALMIAAALPCAAAYPDRPVHFIVGFPPGGGTDVLARVIAQKLSEKWGQPVIVENKPGADGTIAGDLVAHAPPDGYMVDIINTNHEISPSVHKLNFDALKSFAAVTQIAYVPDALVVHPSVPAHNVSELIAYAKANPGKLNDANIGLSALMETVLFKSRAGGIDLVDVPYSGSAPARTALLGGEIQVMFGAVSGALPLVKQGKVRAIAVNAYERFPLMPDVPTLEEEHIGDIEFANSWVGALVPAGTARETVNKLHDDIIATLDLPELHKFMEEEAFIRLATGPDEFAVKLAKDMQVWGPLLKQSGVVK